MSYRDAGYRMEAHEDDRLVFVASAFSIAVDTLPSVQPPRSEYKAKASMKNVGSGAGGAERECAAARARSSAWLFSREWLSRCCVCALICKKLIPGVT